MRTFLLALPILLVMLPALAMPGAPSFSDWDSNGDGKVSYAEMKLAQSRQFKATDANHDGVITLDEVLNLLPGLLRGPARPKIQAYIRAFDSNRDGKLSYAEAMNGTKPRFANIDTNHDGLIDTEEFNHRGLPGK